MELDLCTLEGGRTESARLEFELLLCSGASMIPSLSLHCIPLNSVQELSALEK